MDYEHEKRALEILLADAGGSVREELQQIDDDALDALLDALEDLALIADEQAILREKMKQAEESQ